MIDIETLATKPNAVVLNFARGELVEWRGLHSPHEMPPPPPREPTHPTASKDTAHFPPSFRRLARYCIEIGAIDNRGYGMAFLIYAPLMTWLTMVGRVLQSSSDSLLLTAALELGAT